MKKKNKLLAICVSLLIILMLVMITMLAVSVKNKIAKQKNNSNQDGLADNSIIDGENLLEEEFLQPSKTKEEILSSILVGSVLTVDIKPLDILEKLGVEVPDLELDWEEIYATNKDTYAWIYVPDTSVNFPVVQHPIDNAFYLNHNIDGSAGYPGSIYSELYNTKDFTDPNTVLYGHNLDNETAFSTLHNFEDAELFEEDHYIYIYTEDYVYVYYIFGAYDYESIHLLANFDTHDQALFDEYLDKVFSLEGSTVNMKQELPVDVHNGILTLSTCTRYHNPSYRFLVQGVLLNPKK